MNQYRNHRPVYNPANVNFKSHYDKFGKIAFNKEKNLSLASLSSDSSASKLSVPPLLKSNKDEIIEEKKEELPILEKPELPMLLIKD